MNIFFSGIGGIGISALALIYKSLGFNVKGSDLRESPVTHKLQNLGIEVFIPQTKENITDNKIDFLIKTNALPDNHIELTTAHALNIPVFSYPQALGILASTLPSIGIAGTHGKTTTTAMVSKIFLSCNKEIFGLVGAFFKDFNNTNYKIPSKLNTTTKDILVRTLKTILQKSYGNNNLKHSNNNFKYTKDLFVNFNKDYSLPYFVFEADEYKDAFLNHNLDYLIIASVDFDHADYFKTQKNYLTTFAKAILNTKQGIVANLQDKYIKQVIKIAKDLDISKKLKNLKFIDWSLYINKAQKSPLYFKTKFLIEDTAIALALVDTLKLNKHCINKGIKEFSGVWRRFDIVKTKPLYIVNDYAHNSKKLLYAGLALIDFAKQHNLKTVYIYWEPHQYNRTYTLFNEFAKTIENVLDYKIVKKFVITEIYGARSSAKDKLKINAQIFVKKVKVLLPPNLASKLYYGGDTHSVIKEIKYFFTHGNHKNHSFDIITTNFANKPCVRCNVKTLGVSKKETKDKVRPDAILIASAGKLGEEIYEI